MAESDSIETAIKRMGAAGVRRLPVVNAHGALVGVLVAADVTEHLSKELTDLGRIGRYQRSREASLRKPLVSM